MKQSWSDRGRAFVRAGFDVTPIVGWGIVVVAMIIGFAVGQPLVGIGIILVAGLTARFWYPG